MTVRKARGFVLVGINAAKFLAVGIINGDQPVMMFAAAIPVKSGFVFFRGALGGALSHVAVLSPYWWWATITNKRKTRKYR